MRTTWPSREVGTIGVFEPYVGDRRLTFKPEGGGFVDTQTGSHWNVLGRATDGPLAGKQLTLHPHLDTFWFGLGGVPPGHPDSRPGLAQRRLTYVPHPGD